jgi:hypothetical protein
MRKTVITIIGSLLITVSAVHLAAASEHHARRAYDRWDFRRSYNQLDEPFYAVPQTRAQRNIENFGFSGRDPSRVGGWDPNLNPSGS